MTRFENPTADVCQHGNALSSCIKGLDSTDKLNNRQLLKKSSPNGIGSLTDIKLSTALTFQKRTGQRISGFIVYCYEFKKQIWEHPNFETTTAKS